MRSGSPEEARKRIDEELVDLEKRVRELKVERNTYAPFANLPADILLEIFEAVKEGVDFSAWYKVIGVCRLWRTVAIAAPTLWMNPPTDKHEMLLLMLERSREASLGVDLSDKSSSSAILALRNHVERIRELEIRQTPLSLRNTQDSLLINDRTFSRLENLSIMSTRQVQPTQQKAFVLSSAPLYQSITLRSIRLAFIGFDWGIFPIPNLTHLSLRNIYHTAQISGDQLIHILQQMPYLETLFLDPWAFMDHNMPGTGANKATLNHLSRLRIRLTTPTQARYLLSHMSLPILDDLLIYCNHVPNTADGDYSTLFQAIFCAITNGSFVMLESLVLYANDFEIRPSEDGIRYNGVEFTLQDDGEHHNASVIIKALTSFIATNSILARLPRLNLFPLLHLSELLPLCNVMASVETIHASDYAFNTLVTVFSAQASPNILFPNLKTIILEVYDFYDDPEYLQRLCACLIERREYGVPVHEIFLKQCTITDDDLNRLRDIVANVQVISESVSL